MATDTPRTDAEFTDDYYVSGYVPTEFAQQLERELAEKTRLLAESRKGLNSVVDLINDSHGVTGLHLNGDVAQWEELRTGGRFEDWLIDFDAAIKESK